MPKALMRDRLISLVIVFAFMLVSCTSYKAIQVPAIESQLKEGDIVRVVTTDGRDLKFKITGITSDAVAGENQRILFKEIITLEKREVSTAKTTGLAAGILAVLALGVIVLICAQSLLSDCP
jgi:hypothetical protein